MVVVFIGPFRPDMDGFGSSRPDGPIASGRPQPGQVQANLGKHRELCIHARYMHWSTEFISPYVPQQCGRG